MTKAPSTKRRRWGPFRQGWISICSKHRDPEPDCQTCACGSWHNQWVRRIDSAIYARWPRLWGWWHNRPNSRHRREMRQWFPNMK